MRNTSTYCSRQKLPLQGVGGLLFYHPDHLGSSSFITDVNGEAYQHYEYMPYGELFVEQKGGTDQYTPYLFNGKELDDKTGLYYYGARYLDPKTSIWLSVDPLGEMDFSISFYAYCHNNPVNMIDPDGKTDYYNLSGKKYHVEDGKSDKKLALTYSKSEKGFNNAIKENKTIVFPSKEVMKKFEDAYENTDKSGNESGFLVGEKGKASIIVEGSPTSISEEDWQPAAENLQNIGDEYSYDVHTHPNKKDEKGNTIAAGGVEPSPEDKEGNNNVRIILGSEENISNQNNTTISFDKSEKNTPIKTTKMINFINNSGGVVKMKFEHFKNVIKKCNDNNAQ